MAQKPLDEAVIRAAAEAFLRAGGNATAAAALSGVNRSTLLHRLSKGVVTGILSPDYSIHTGSSADGKRRLVLSDMHAPFQHPDTLAFLDAVVEKYQPDAVVGIGDEVDNHAISDYPSDPDGLSARAEYEKALEFMQALYKRFPVMSVCESNHTSRAYRKAFKVGLPKVMIRSYGEVWQAPMGWQWADEWEFDGVLYRHGEGYYGENAHVLAAKKHMQSVVIGHVHAHAGVRIVQAKRNVWGMNVGCLIDTRAYAMRYAKNMPIPVTLGCGIVHGGRRAEFVPLLTDKRGRWTEEL